MEMCTRCKQEWADGTDGHCAKCRRILTQRFNRRPFNFAQHQRTLNFIGGIIDDTVRVKDTD